jgi:nicotinate dehydrogenase subunit A
MQSGRDSGNSADKGRKFSMATITLKVNGNTRTVQSDPDVPLLYVLRNEFELQGPKFGCGEGQCGACTVIMDGEAVLSCLVTVSDAQNRSITTLEGIGSNDRPHPLQQAFVAEQAAQCGYCSNGMILTAKALLDKNPNPTEAQIKTALEGVLCRCGAHNRIVRAVQRVAQEGA